MSRGTIRSDKGGKHKHDWAAQMGDEGYEGCNTCGAMRKEPSSKVTKKARSLS